VDAPIWRCRTPFVPGTRIENFYRALAGARPLYAVLPGGTQSIYDGLIDCL
jgi:hypothetical protein